MSQRDVRHVAAKLKKFMLSRDYSQAAVAKKLGVSSSQISQFVAGKYKGDSDKLVNAVVSFINDESRQVRQTRRRGFVQTAVAEKVAAIIKNTIGFSEEEAKIGVIIGDGGHGKSLCLKEYHRAHSSTSLYLELDSAMNAKLIFADICKKLKVDTGGSLPTVSRSLIDSLDGRHMIVLLDEASYLSVKQLDQLRQVITVKCHCPLVLAGNRELYKTVMRPIDYLDQFTSRMTQVLDLDELANRDDGGLYSVDDIRKLYQFGGIRLTGDAVSALRKICQSPRSGRLRTCSHLINALHTADVVSESGKIDAAMIVAAIEQLELPVRVRLPLATRGLEQDDQEHEAVAAAG